MSVAMFLGGLTVSIYKMPWFVIALLILEEIVLIGTYGKYDETEILLTYWNLESICLVFGILVLFIDKFTYHIILKKSLTLFNR